jgi:hypothetical protein
MGALSFCGLSKLVYRKIPMSTVGERKAWAAAEMPITGEAMVAQKTARRGRTTAAGAVAFRGPDDAARGPSRSPSKKSLIFISEAQNS